MEFRLEDEFILPRVQIEGEVIFLQLAAHLKHIHYLPV